MFYMLHLKRFQSMEGVTTSGEIDVTCVLNRKRTKFWESFEKNPNLHDDIQSFLTFKCRLNKNEVDSMSGYIFRTYKNTWNGT